MQKPEPIVIKSTIESYLNRNLKATIKPNDPWEPGNKDVYIELTGNNGRITNRGYAAFSPQDTFEIIKGLAETAGLNVLKVGERLCIKAPEPVPAPDDIRKEEIAQEYFGDSYKGVTPEEGRAVDRIFELEKKVST